MGGYLEMNQRRIHGLEHVSGVLVQWGRGFLLMKFISKVDATSPSA
jgi:hypothetical protein